METHIQVLLEDSCSKIDYYNLIRASSINECLSSHVPMIGTLNKHNHVAAIEIITYGISSLLGFLGLKQSMNPDQILMTAELLLEDYSDIPIDALKLFFRNVAKGKYGQTYNSIDGQKLLIWFRQFYDEYMHELLEVKQREHEANKSDKYSLLETIVSHKVEEILSGEELQRRVNRLMKRGYYTDDEIAEQEILRKTTIREFQRTHKMLEDKDFNELEQLVNQRLADVGFYNNNKSK